MSTLLKPCIHTSTHCTIGRLPTETLEAIFVHYAQDRPIGFDYRPIPHFVNVSYVCRLWRNVALNSQALWSNLSIASPRWTEESLARSRQAPLKFHARLDGDENPTGLGLCSLKQVMLHLERIQELTLELCFIDYEEVLPYLSSCAPRLEYLDIKTLHYPSAESPSSLPIVGDTPALRTLVLLRCPLAWFSLKLNHLTELDLDSDREFQQDVVEFLATLRCMQELEHLSLSHVLTSSVDFLTSVPFHTFQKFHLSRLSDVYMGELMSTIIVLLSCLSISPKCALTLNCQAENVDIFSSSSLNGYVPLCDLLAERFRAFENLALSIPTVRSLTIESPKGGGTTVIFSSSERDCDSGPLEITLDLRYLETDDHHPVISHVCCFIPLPDVRTLHILHDPVFPVDFWTRILGHLKGLHCIKLRKGPMPEPVDLVSALSVTPRGLTSHFDQGQAILAPALEELDLCGVVFSTTLQLSANLFDHVSVRSFCQALATRRGTRGRLTMRKCILKRDSQGKMFDMTGWWDGSHIHVSGGYVPFRRPVA